MKRMQEKQMKVPVYLIIKTGHEGIEDLCYLTESSNEAITKIMELRKEALEKEKQLAEEMQKKGSDHRVQEDVGDFFCIQEWDGKQFECVCGKLGVNPSKLMLRW